MVDMKTRSEIKPNSIFISTKVYKKNPQIFFNHSEESFSQLNTSKGRDNFNQGSNKRKKYAMYSAEVKKKCIDMVLLLFIYIIIIVQYGRSSRSCQEASSTSQKLEEMA